MNSLIRLGRRSLELQNWCSSRFVVKLEQNASAVSNSASATSHDLRHNENLFISNLIDLYIWIRKFTEWVSKKKKKRASNLEIEEDSDDSVSNLFRTHSFTNYQRSRKITCYPRHLIANAAEKTLGSKLEYVQIREASSPISFYNDVIREMSRDEEAEEEEEADSMISPHDNIIRDVFVLKELGVPQELLTPLFNFNTLESVNGQEKYKESIKKVVEIGFDPTTLKIFQALRVSYVLRDKTIVEKVNVYTRLGMAVGDVWTMFKKHPQSLTISEKKITQTYETYLGLGFSRDEFVMMVKNFPQCINCSEKSVKKKTEFLVKKMNWPLEALVLNSIVFGYNLEKKIFPRCNVIKALMSKGLLGDLPPIRSVLCSTNDEFLKMYVRKHDDKEVVHELMSI